MKIQIALVLTGVMFGLLCAGLATYAYTYAHASFNAETCVVEYYIKPKEVHVWQGRTK